MAEIYPMKASGEYAGAKCSVKNCPRYGRYLLQPINAVNGKRLACGTHLGPIVKGIMYTDSKAVVIQEVPGNWLANGGEMAEVNGELRRVHISTRQVMDRAV